jgi:hypothetical protein
LKPLRSINATIGGKKGSRRFLVLMPLVIERMMEMAGETAEALESRGLSLNPAGEKDI